MSTGKSCISLLQQRRIEAAIVKPIYETLAAEFGTERARALIGTAIRQAAREAGAELAREAGNATSLATFAAVFERWKEGNAFDLDVLVQDDRQFDFNIRRCAYAEMYQEMGLSAIGDLLSCQRDAALCEGYDARVTMKRTQTLMQGAAYCDFRYSYDRTPSADAETSPPSGREPDEEKSDP